jgi:DNA-binding transcriptional regulator YiaG
MAVVNSTRAKRLKEPRLIVRNPTVIRTLRHATGMSEARLAALVGVSSTTIHYWESGRAGNNRGIGKARAERLLRALHLDPDHPDAIGDYVTGRRDARPR